MATTESLNHILEKHEILPKTHFGGRTGRSTTDAIHHLVKYVHDAWRSGKVVSALFLDVKGAYPSVDVNRLIHEMRKRGIPRELTGWIREKLTGRETVICFDDYRSDPIGIDAGLDQGCSLSGSLYGIYNAPLVEVPKPGRAREEISVAFVDDVALATKGKDFREANGKLEDMMNREGGALEWADSANCEFEIDKFALMGFSKKQIPRPFEPRKRQPIPRFGITIRGHRLKPTSSTKYLGVIINQSMSWAEQSAAAMAVGMKWVTSCKRIAKPTQGIPLKLIKRLYLAACVPKMLYAVDVWGAPLLGKANAERKKKCGGQLGKLERVQRQALIMLGAMKTTATDILEAHANLLPFHLLVDKARHNALLRMATLPESNPIYQHLARAQKVHVKRHKSPLHKLLAAYPDIKPDKMEKVKTVRRKPQWKPPFSTHIEGSKEKAKESAGARREDIQIYTDGSGYRGGIGAAATSWRTGRGKKTLKLHLGSDRRQIVYGGEVTGLILAMELLRKETRPFDSVFIGIDNQAAIKATERHRTAPGQFLVDAFRDELDEIRRTKGNFDCQIHWTPGHSGIERNDHVDGKAKEAAQGQSSRKTDLPRMLRDILPHSKAAVKQAYASKLKERAAKHWKRSKRYSQMSKIDKSLPSNKFTKLTDKLSRNQSSMLLQLRTGHAPLNKHLHRIGSIESPTCPACEMEAETVHHFITTCPAREITRRKTLNTLGRRARSMETLLTDPKAIPYLFAYVKATGRFKNTFRLENRKEKARQTER
jgi:ribonuclease HI